MNVLRHPSLVLVALPWIFLSTAGLIRAQQIEFLAECAASPLPLNVDCVANPADCKAQHCSKSTVYCDSLDLNDLLDRLRACAGPTGQIAQGHHNFLVQANAAGVTGPALRWGFDVKVVLEEDTQGEWFLGNEGAHPEDVLVNPLARGSFLASSCPSDASCFKELELPQGLSGTFLLGLRLGSKLKGYELCFGDGLTAFVERTNDDPEIYWGPLRVETLSLPKKQVSLRTGFLAEDCFFGENCGLAGDEDKDGFANDADDECQPPRKMPKIDFLLNAEGTMLCAEADPADFPGQTGSKRACAHVFDGPGEVFLPDLFLDLEPPMIMTPIQANANCLDGDLEPCVRIDWKPGGGFDAFDVKVDDQLLRRLPGDARSFLHPICAGDHNVQVVGVRRHFAVPEGVCYLSDAATFTSTRSCEPTFFHRGDADGNGELQITDAVRILDFLFLGAAAPTCLDAADADGNNQLQLTDAVRILGFLFVGCDNPPPVTPGPPPNPCGPDNDNVHLGCQKYDKC